MYIGAEFEYVSVSLNCGQYHGKSRVVDWGASSVLNRPSCVSCPRLPARPRFAILDDIVSQCAS